MSDDLFPPAGLRPRLISMVLDYFVIASWIAVLTVVGFATRPVLPRPAGPPSVAAADAIAFLLTVLPVWLYLTVSEAGRHHATPGKRAAGLRVLGADEWEPGPGTVCVRNAVKLAPWQLAHLAVARLIVDEQAAVALACYVASLVFVAVTVFVAVRDPRRRGLHDIVAGTRVVDSPLR